MICGDIDVGALGKKFLDHFTGAAANQKFSNFGRE